MSEYLDQQMQIAMQLQGEGRIGDVETVCRQMLEHDREYTPALRLLGAVLGHTSRFEEAAELLSRCVRIDPNDGVAHSTLGAALQTLGHPDKALVHMARAVELQPEAAQFRYNYGKALRDQKRNDEAAIEFLRAIELQPAFAPAYNNLGNTLRDLGRPEEAIPFYQSALQFRPNYPPTLHNMGLSFRDLLRLPEAMRCFDTALAFDPGYHECRMSRGMVLLLAGHFPLGWNEYEARFDIPRANANNREYGKPVWDGADPEGRTILLYAEQGFGDAIQFVRYAPLLSQRGAHVIVECRPELVGLFASLRGVDQVLSTEDELPDLDVYRGLMSMPHLFGTALDSVPAEVPYLRADRAKVRRWRKIIEPGGIRIGLVWAGAAGYGNDHIRSLTLHQLAPLADAAPEGTRFYSLQKGPAAGQALEPPRNMHVLDLSAELTDFTETAAAIENLDLVISVDTAVAHLAGAMGKPVWIMIPHVPDWRWMLNRADSPWYPTAKLFRQPTTGDWDAVIRSVAADLPTFAPQ